MAKIETTIDRKPGDCDFDIEEICKEVKRQNRLGNKLKSWTIGQDKIVLQFG
jgi:translation elongation factor EF-1beta